MHGAHQAERERRSGRIGFVPAQQLPDGSAADHVGRRTLEQLRVQRRAQPITPARLEAEEVRQLVHRFEALPSRRDPYQRPSSAMLV